MRHRIRFDRGTLELGPEMPECALALWDPRSESRRVPAYQFREVIAGLAGLDDDPRAGWQHRPRDTSSLELRPYQVQALASWTAMDCRGVIGLPTGAGKTRVAIAAIFETGLPTAVLCPTRAIANAWEDKTIVFTAFAENAYDAGIDNLIPVITDETGANERKAILSGFREGFVRAIASARVLNEGVDVPDARVAIIVAGVLGDREFVQRVGRVLRPTPGKHAVVYELYTTNTFEARRAVGRYSYGSGEVR